MVMLPLAAQAGELDDFVDNLSVEARADSSGFRYRLRSQFNVGDATVDMVIGNVDDLAHAYMIFRLGQITGYSTQSVLDVYKANRGKGWGVIAKELGIKPGSSEFHALKARGGSPSASSGGGKGGKGGKGKGRK
jgi:hypothetical protein